MKADPKTEPGRQARDRGRAPYRLTGEQVFKMIETGIIDGGDVELWDGVLYRMTKGELHNYIVTETAEAIRLAAPRDNYHVREEKSSRDGVHSLPEPDVAVARGSHRRSRPEPPPLEQLALVVEVDHHTARTDRVVKLRRYAARGIPVYWIIQAKRGRVLVNDTPRGKGKSAGYLQTRIYSGAAEIPIVLDGTEVGRVTASDLFPIPEAEAPAGPCP